MFSVPALETLQGVFQIVENPHLVSLSIPAAFIGDSIEIRQNPVLRDITFPEATVGGNPSGWIQTKKILYMMSGKEIQKIK